MKTIVITGASSGIGFACCKAALAAGHKVLATARKQTDLEKLESLGAIAIPLELTDPQSITHAAQQISKYGEIDVLFNNAGYGLQVAMEDSSWEALQEQHTTNVIGPVTLTNALLDKLKPGSQLIFNSSILGVITLPLRGPYCMSKHALESAADAYRLELEPLGIQVHVIQPGPIEAAFRANALAKSQACLNGKNTRLNYTAHFNRLAAETLTEGTLPAKATADVFMDIIEGRRQRNRYLITAIAKKAALAKRLLGSTFHHVARRAEPVSEKR